MQKQVFIFVLFILEGLSTAFAGDILVNLSQHRVPINESFSVSFSSQQSIETQPDFSPLQIDFEILSKTQGINTSIINGKISQETNWSLELVGKREGALTIPSIKFGSDTSPAQSVEIIKAQAVKQDEAIFLEVTVDPKTEVFEQTPLIYSIRLYRAVQIAQAGLSEIKTNDPDALIERLGNDIEYEHHGDNGKHYIVFERKYTVLPQHAGELIFAPIAFEGKVVTGGHSFFDVQTQFKRMHSDQVKIAVKPIPAPFKKSNWFAANQVTLAEEWSTDPSKMILGEPITWTLTLQAEGCLGNQIPEIALDLPENLTKYLDKPDVSTQSSAKGFEGVKQIKVALIATKPGEIVLPELNIPWWDLKNSQARTVSLPARTLHIQNGTIAMNGSWNDQASTDAKTQTLQSSAGDQFETKQSLPWWVWCLAGVNAALLIGAITFLAIRIYARRLKPDSLSTIRQQLRQACQNNDAKQAQIWLLAWAKIQYPQVLPFNFIAINSRLSKPLQEAIAELHQFLYGQKEHWSGEALWQAFAGFKPSPKSKAKIKADSTEILQELYPRH